MKRNLTPGSACSVKLLRIFHVSLEISHPEKKSKTFTLFFYFEGGISLLKYLKRLDVTFVRMYERVS